VITARLPSFRRRREILREIRHDGGDLFVRDGRTTLNHRLDDPLPRFFGGALFDSNVFALYEAWNSIDRGGAVLDGSSPLRAEYVVAPRSAGVVGRVVAADIPGRLVLVRPERGVVRIAPSGRAAWRCRLPKHS
jgi:hypothetical protein